MAQAKMKSKMLKRQRKLRALQGTKIIVHNQNYQFTQVLLISKVIGLFLVLSF